MPRKECEERQKSKYFQRSEQVQLHTEASQHRKYCNTGHEVQWQCTQANMSYTATVGYQTYTSKTFVTCPSLRVLITFRDQLKTKGDRLPALERADLLLAKTRSRVIKCWQLHHGRKMLQPLAALLLGRAWYWHPSIEAGQVSRPQDELLSQSST